MAGFKAFTSPGFEQDQVDAGRDEVVDLVDLLAKVVIVAERQQLHVRVGLLGLELRAPWRAR